MNALDIGIISTIIGLILTVIGVGIKIGSHSQGLKDIKTRVEKAEVKIEKHGDDIHSSELKFESIKGSLSLLEEIMRRIEQKVEKGEKENGK